MITWTNALCLHSLAAIFLVSFSLISTDVSPPGTFTFSVFGNDKVCKDVIVSAEEGFYFTAQEEK